MSKGRGRLLYRPNQPRFFRIILADSLFQNKLAIPKSFARNYGNYLSNWVMLKVPSGKQWKLGIVKAGGEVSLKEGWQQFVEYYSIVVGTFLVFQFDPSDCSFCVSIFDCSTTEIDYPYQVEASRVSEAEETLSQIPVERKRKEKTQVFSAEPPKKMNKVESSTTLEKGTEETNKAIDKARSQNPSFVIVMWPSYVKCGGNVAIPRCFARKYLREKNGNAVLCDSEGRRWPVEYHTNMTTGTTKISYPGWRKFLKDCLLQVGDVCMFELVDPAKTIIRVVISRRNQSRGEPVCKSSFPPPAAKTSNPLDGIATLKRVEIKEKSPLSSSQPRTKIKAENIPKRTARVPKPEYEKGVANRAITRNRWMKLEEKVEVLDKASSAFQSKSPTFQAKMNITNQDSSNELVRKPPFPAAEKLTSLFNVVIRPSHIDGKGCVHLPWNFVVKLDGKKQDVKLQVGKRVWSVKLLTYPNHMKGLLSRGWHAFARENCLKLGDVCYFELIDMKSMVIKVIISRVVN